MELKQKTSSVFKIGSICLVFLVIGYQAALFINRAAILMIESHRDKPDTVYIVRSYYTQDHAAPANNPQPALSSYGGSTARMSGPNSSDEAPTVYDTIRRNAPHSPRVSEVRRATRKVENFRFNPNTASKDDFIRLGFSDKQAQSIINYREKGGKFRRKSDFAKSYVVSDSVFRRLEPWIDIPLLDINRADSAAFDELPGVGPYFAAKMVEMREELGGYSHKEQLLDIRNFGRERYDPLVDIILCSEPDPYPLWSLPADSLRLHPYIRDWQTARAIVLYRSHTPADRLSVQGLIDAGIMSYEYGEKLARCRIAPP